MKRRGMNQVQIIVLACAGIYGMLALLLAIVPGEVLSTTPPGPGVLAYSDLAARGREVYVSEGCSYCHTQQVRPQAQDRVWGRPSTLGDYAYATPQLLGTERTGPDLSNIGVRQPGATWHLIHLYQPRSLVSASIMPAYPWMFVVKEKAESGDVVVSVPPEFAPHGKVVVAGPDALALVAYLTSLKQAALPAGRVPAP